MNRDRLEDSNGHSSTETSLSVSSTPNKKFAAAASPEFKSTIHAFEQLSANSIDESARSQNIKKVGMGFPIKNRFPATKVGRASPSGPKPENTISVSVLGTQDTGLYSITTDVTFFDLRQQISERLGHNNFAFLDLTTKRPLAAEDRLVHSYKGSVMVCQTGLDNLLATSTLPELSNAAISRESATFKVFWWDATLQGVRPVWLKMEPMRIVVSSNGGAFRLFDASTLRNPLKFAGVRGSDKGFQLVKAGSRWASRFFAQTVEQKHLISVFFCFVWRPNAVRRGWIPRLDVDISKVENVQDAMEPRSFVNLLRRHILEIDRIITELERTMDSKLVRHYLNVFASMFSGGYMLKEGNLTSPLNGSELQSFGKVSKMMQDWQEKVAKRQKEANKSGGNDGQGSQDAPKSKRKQEEEVAFEAFFEEMDDPFDENNTNNAAKPVHGVVVGDDSIPPPPPPPGSAPGLGGLQQKPAICPVSFDGISASDIVGTIWADMTNMSMKEKEMMKLEQHLRIIFGREGRDRTSEKQDNDDGILETNRLRNLEVLMYMEELKPYSTDELIDLILQFDKTVFQPAVLERLVRRIAKDQNSQEAGYAFLPTQKESEALIAHYEKHGAAALKPGELFFLQLVQQVPDRVQRFEFGYFMSRLEDEVPEILESLDVIRVADKAIRSSNKFKAALKIVLDILTTLMPRFGLTRGFRISSFVPSVDRVSGTVSNPTADTNESNDGEAAKSVASPSEPTKDELPSDPRARRLMKLEALKRKVEKREAEFWHVRLQEYMTVYMNRFEVCQGFWSELMEPCENAMRIDLGLIDVQTTEWSAQLEALELWYEEEGSKSPSSAKDGFSNSVSKFLNTTAKELVKLRAAVTEVKALTESLWKWMGEVMGTEPCLIFKYIYEFSNTFKSHWKSLETQWDEKRTLVMRGVLKLEKPPAPTKKRSSTKNNKPNRKSKTLMSRSSSLLQESPASNRRAEDEDSPNDSPVKIQAEREESESAVIGKQIASPAPPAPKIEPRASPRTESPGLTDTSSSPVPSDEKSQAPAIQTKGKHKSKSKEKEKEKKVSKSKKSKNASAQPSSSSETPSSSEQSRYVGPMEVIELKDKSKKSKKSSKSKKSKSGSSK